MYVCAQASLRSPTIIMWCAGTGPLRAARTCMWDPAWFPMSTCLDSSQIIIMPAEFAVLLLLVLKMYSCIKYIKYITGIPYMNNIYQYMTIHEFLQ